MISTKRKVTEKMKEGSAIRQDQLSCSFEEGNKEKQAKDPPT